MRSVGRMCGLWEKSANSENSGKIRSERLRRFSASDFAPASQNLNGPSESTTLRVDKLSLYSDIGYNTVDCEHRALGIEISEINFFSSLPPMIHHFRSWLEPLPLQPEKTADIWRRYNWFPRQMTSEKRAQKSHTDEASLLRSGQYGAFWGSKLSATFYMAN